MSWKYINVFCSGVWGQISAASTDNKVLSFNLIRMSSETTSHNIIIHVGACMCLCQLVLDVLYINWMHSSSFIRLPNWNHLCLHKLWSSQTKSIRAWSRKPFSIKACACRTMRSLWMGFYFETDQQSFHPACAFTGLMLGRETQQRRGVRRSDWNRALQPDACNLTFPPTLKSTKLLFYFFLDWKKKIIAS